MKKIFSFLAIAAIVASCAKTEPVYTEDNSEIKLAPVTTHVTKANVLSAIDGTEYPTAENFDVYAYWNTAEAGSSFTEATLYLGSEDDCGVEFTNKGAYWGGTTTYYWPKNGSLRFAAYSPSHLDLKHTLATDTYSVAGYLQPSNTAETFDFLVAPTSVSYNAMTAAEKVVVEFQHGLSWITLQVKAKDAEAAKAFDVKKVTINNVNTKADFAANMNTGIQNGSWNNLSTPANYVVFSGSQAVTETATVIETTTAGTLVIPQATTTVTVDYTQNALAGTPELEGQSVTVDLVLDEDNTPWAPGKHYIYTLIFGLDEILINPSVVDWTDVEVGEIDTDKTVNNVSTEAQLHAAFAEGGKVVLQKNITLTKALNVTNTVVLDLNGKNLTNTVYSDPNADTDVIVVAPTGSLTINGKGTVEAVSGSDGYAVVSEGLLIINDGTFKSGIDAAGEINAVVYARSEGHIVVNGGTFPNENKSGFVLNKKDQDRMTTTIEVAGGTFTSWNPADNAAEEPGTNFLKAGFAVVADGDVYTVVPASEYVSNLAEGGDVTLYSDLAIDESVVVNGDLKLDLNGKTISVNKAVYVKDVTSAVISVAKNANVTLSNGVVDGRGYEDYGVEVRGGNLTIKDGYYYGDCSVVYAREGVVTIEGGYFEAGQTEWNTTYLLNCLDDNYKTGAAKIVVKGGQFKGFNPANNEAEGAATNFLAEGYTVSYDAATDVYSVVAE